MLVYDFPESCSFEIHYHIFTLQSKFSKYENNESEDGSDDVETAEPIDLSKLTAEGRKNTLFPSIPCNEQTSNRFYVFNNNILL